MHLVFIALSYENERRQVNLWTALPVPWGHRKYSGTCEALTNKGISSLSTLNSALASLLSKLSRLKGSYSYWGKFKFVDSYSSWRIRNSSSLITPSEKAQTKASWSSWNDIFHTMTVDKWFSRSSLLVYNLNLFFFFFRAKRFVLDPIHHRQEPDLSCSSNRSHSTVVLNLKFPSKTVCEIRIADKKCTGNLSKISLRSQSKFTKSERLCSINVVLSYCIERPGI